MSDPTYAAGTSVFHGAETLLRQILMERIVILASDEQLQRQLFARQDTLLQGSQAAWVEECVQWIRELPARLKVFATYPHDEPMLPCISVVLNSANEDPAAAVCGDVWDRQSEMIGTLSSTDATLSAVYDHIEYGMGMQVSVQVGSWATGPEEASLLHTVVRWALHSGKDAMLKIGMRDIVLSESGFSPEQSPLYPHVPYVPAVSAQLNYWFRYRERTGPQKHRVQVTACSFTF